MGSGPKYNRFKRFMHDMSTKQMRINKETINVKSGKGQYPHCLQKKPYNFCPKDVPEDLKNIPEDCKQCPHFLKSKFYSEIYMTRERRIENLKRRGLPLVLESK